MKPGLFPGCAGMARARIGHCAARGLPVGLLCGVLEQVRNSCHGRLARRPAPAMLRAGGLSQKLYRVGPNVGQL
jgi:hypothetical protein